MKYKKITKIKNELIESKNKENFIKDLLELTEDEQAVLIASVADDMYDYDNDAEVDNEKNKCILAVLKDPILNLLIECFSMIHIYKKIVDFL